MGDRCTYDTGGLRERQQSEQTSPFPALAAAAESAARAANSVVQDGAPAGVIVSATCSRAVSGAAGGRALGRYQGSGDSQRIARGVASVHHTAHHIIWCCTASRRETIQAVSLWPCGLIMVMDLETATTTPEETRTEFTRLSARGYTQLRHVLVQLPDRGGPRASTLARMLHERKHRPLLLYIMLLTCWPWLKDRRDPLEGSVWIRALTAKGAPTWSPSTLSRSWAELVDLGLIDKGEREGRLIRPVPRREDCAADYELPSGRRDRWNMYFALPDQFWTEELFAKLPLPALVMLLLVAKETNGKDEVWLTYENAEEWYGIKPKSAQNGLTELQKLGLLHRRAEVVKAPLAPHGRTVRMWYSLTGPFSHQSRAALQKRAAKQRSKRLKRDARAAALHPKEQE
ncbi:MAG: hypothetical protein B5766_00095 [Candidatus Lumbricidophila eiseniae]|uniref:Uncharacterized protein n=1 Tax=Candidatus Lumbricidiphila eiseniae TaxID=1969409 RepID=A0A2A6FVA7_9MICO|nr:MAG: hypothetical protein B5766_00095 [Candidatus Lumbricidophila eiseniae]